VEKLLTTLLLVFILLIASFNIIGSLSMLIIDKSADIRTLSHLGASEDMIRRIFLFEGWLVSGLGAIIGLIAGIIICLIQEHFGLLKLGSGSEYIISAYPVAVQATDIVLVACIVLVLGAIAAWIPAKQIKIQHETN
jgi:ABC-type lipoprotein release transport system permease subunit